MMHDFLRNNRDELISRCKAKVLARPHRRTSAAQLNNGVPLVLEQLTRTLLAESRDQGAASLLISGPTGGAAPSEISCGAAEHGKVLLDLGYTVDEVVHNYGDLCQAITELAIERDAPFAVDEFRTLNRCLDNAIAQSVNSFSAHRDLRMADRLASTSNEKVGSLVHELRNALYTASLSVTALELGALPISGATGSVLKRSLASMKVLVDRSMTEIAISRTEAPLMVYLSVASLIDEAQDAARLDATTRGRLLDVGTVDPALHVEVNREFFLGALANLLGNAFKFTHDHSTVTLSVHAVDDRILIEVADECGGISEQTIRTMFAPFSQSNRDRSGLGLGLPIARARIEAMGGTLTARNVADVGCVFTIALPRSVVERRATS